ncbi:MAG: enoyl-CoA hydratase-related protein [Bacillota bacterium]
MDYKYLSCRLVEESIWKISLSRPDVLNSLNRPMLMELIESLKYASTDRQVRVILLTGEGRAFSAGQDLKEVIELEGAKADPGEIVRQTYNPLISLMREIEKPIICFVNGIAAGAAANIAFASDIILASKEASFVQSFSKIGLIPDSGGTYFLPRLIGLHRSAALMMTADKISATEAKELGLVYRVFDAEEVEARVMEFSMALSQMPTRALGLIKAALNKTFSNDLPGQLLLESELQAKAGKTGDYSEGVRAFLEKRKPKYSGK